MLPLDLEQIPNRFGFHQTKMPIKNWNCIQPPQDAGNLSISANHNEIFGQFSYSKTCKSKYNQHAAAVAQVLLGPTGGVAAKV